MTYPESIMKPARLIADRWADDDNTEECAEAIAVAIVAAVAAERERYTRDVGNLLQAIGRRNEALEDWENGRVGQ